MVRLGAVVPVVFKLDAGNPTTFEVSQVPSKLCVIVPNVTPFDTSCWLIPGGVDATIACRSAVICLATISKNPHSDCFPIVGGVVDSNELP